MDSQSVQIHVSGTPPPPTPPQFVQVDGANAQAQLVQSPALGNPPPPALLQPVPVDRAANSDPTVQPQLVETVVSGNHQLPGKFTSAPSDHQSQEVELDDVLNMPGLNSGPENDTAAGLEDSPIRRLPLFAYDAPDGIGMMRSSYDAESPLRASRTISSYCPSSAHPIDHETGAPLILQPGDPGYSEPNNASSPPTMFELSHISTKLEVPTDAAVQPQPTQPIQAVDPQLMQLDTRTDEFTADMMDIDPNESFEPPKGLNPEPAEQPAVRASKRERRRLAKKKKTYKFHTENLAEIHADLKMRLGTEEKLGMAYDSTHLILLGNAYIRAGNRGYSVHLNPVCGLSTSYAHKYFNVPFFFSRGLFLVDFKVEMAMS